jgi:hypothetical protein
VARGHQLIRDCLVIHTLVGQQEGCRSLGHALLCLPSPEQGLALLPLFNTQLDRILWT